MSFSHRGPLKYNRPGHPFHGIPLGLADLTFNSQFIGVGAGNLADYLGTLAPAAPSASTTSAYAAGWTVAATSSSTTVGAVSQDNAGQWVLTTGTTDEDLLQLQYTIQPFRYSATSKLWCFARLALSTHNTTDAYFGLAIADTTLIATSAEGVTDSIAFMKAATATDYTLQVQKDGTTTSQAAGLTLTSAAYAVLGFTIDAGVIRQYGVLDPNDQVRSNPKLLGAGTVVANTNAPDDQDVVFSLGVGQEGGTTARTMTVDWAFCVAEHS